MIQPKNKAALGELSGWFCALFLSEPKKRGTTTPDKHTSVACKKDRVEYYRKIPMKQRLYKLTES